MLDIPPDMGAPAGSPIINEPLGHVKSLLDAQCSQPRQCAMGGMSRSRLPEPLQGMRARLGVWRRDRAADIGMQQKSGDAIVLFVRWERNPGFRFGAAAHPTLCKNILCNGRS